MQSRRFGLIMLLAAFATLVAACTSGDAVMRTPAPEGTDGSTGNAVFVVSDAAADMGAVTHIRLTVDQVRVHGEAGGWTTVSSESRTYELLELKASGAAALFAEAELAAGHYNQIQIDVSEVIVVDADGEHEAKLPSNTLRLHGDLDVEADATATANFDFIADRSLHITGQGRYIFAPVIQLETRSNASVEIDTTGVVEITGGSTVTDVRVGTDTDGNIDAGVMIAPDAVLSISGDGRLLQVGGHAMVSGTVKSVDQEEGTVTIATRSGNEITLHINGSSGIVIDGSPATAADLAAGMGAEVSVSYDSESRTVARLSAGADADQRSAVGAGLKIKGTVKSVDKAAGTVTIETDSGAEVTLRADSSTQTGLGGSLSGLLDLSSALGSRVEAEYDASTMAVSELEVKEDGPEGQASATITGTIRSADASAGTITATTGTGVDMTFEIVGATVITVGGSSSAAADLEGMTGSHVEVEYNTGTMAATRISAEADASSAVHVEGTLQAVDTASGAVTIGLQNGQEQVIQTSADTLILADGSAGNLAALAALVGGTVVAEYDAETRVSSRIDAEASVDAAVTVDGVIESVDAAAGTVVILAHGGETLVLNITSETRVKLGGAVSGIASLAAETGSQVEVEYNQETGAATEISVQSGAGATTSAFVVGTLESVSTLAGTVTVATDAGARLVFEVTSESRILINGSASALAALLTEAGSQVSVEYDAAAGAVIVLRVQR
ncbi:MAG: DUF4382 domain-containing protein [Dehalococcoidia bacterium]